MIISDCRQLWVDGSSQQRLSSSLYGHQRPANKLLGCREPRRRFLPLMVPATFMISFINSNISLPRLESPIIKKSLFCFSPNSKVEPILPQGCIQRSSTIIHKQWSSSRRPTLPPPQQYRHNCRPSVSSQRWKLHANSVRDSTPYMHRCLMAPSAVMT